MKWCQEHKSEVVFPSDPVCCERVDRWKLAGIWHPDYQPCRIVAATLTIDPITEEVTGE